MKVVWRDEATANLESIYAYISLYYSEENARNVVKWGVLYQNSKTQTSGNYSSAATESFIGFGTMKSKF
jgi:hypothetical protein